MSFNFFRISFFLIATLSAASVWFYADRILVAYQVQEAAAHERPRGNLSDLYPRWLGARELLLHHRNPYSDEVTTEIQKGYYGRAIDPSRPNDPKDQERFAYPAYVVFLIAPLLGLPFQAVGILFHWLLLLATVGSVWLWLQALRWRLPAITIASAIALTLGSVPAVQGIKIQQLSLLDAALIALAAFCISCGQLFGAGVLLALATIKPQLVWPLAGVLLVWTVSDWRKRRGLAVGFSAMMAFLLLGAEIVLPGWWKWFMQGLGQYHQYTRNQSVIEVTLSEVFGVGRQERLAHVLALLVAGMAVALCGVALWRFRRVKADGTNFGQVVALTLALTVLVVPMYAPYNQVLLLPAIFVLLRDRKEFVSQAAPRRVALSIGAVIVAWQWIASLCLVVVYFAISPARALGVWTWPFLATFAVPLWIFGLIFIHARSVRLDDSP